MMTQAKKKIISSKIDERLAALPKIRGNTPLEKRIRPKLMASVL